MNGTFSALQYAGDLSVSSTDRDGQAVARAAMLIAPFVRAFPSGRNTTHRRLPRSSNWDSGVVLASDWWFG